VSPPDRPVARLAADLRDLRRTLAVCRGTDALAPVDAAEVARLVGAYDRTLLDAARMLEVAVPLDWVVAGGLSDDGRVAVVDAVVAAGLALDPARRRG